MIITIDLYPGSYLISPYSKDTTCAHFTISIAASGKLLIDDTLLEVPSSVEEFDSILNIPIRLIRENTKYTQKISLVEQDNFKVSGLIWFVLEPICIPYEIGFIISYNSGEMKVKKTSTTGCLKKCCKTKYKYFFNDRINSPSS